ncbi:sulfotransferase domain-containing protein [Alteribacillus bidgolensis]|uniref:Sulfotransferase domain-containing protein n=1 Tax=Alteribacillus bidgolensis TaxID=930129 RepID=A0A1G8I270_9BACI|nr:sulfotransferase domain-containing protein [Alteribacillus bidgolensis]SDI13056.1 Sulfotransferase domain-containing protein [Alteribacillus bidgolensis]
MTTHLKSNIQPFFVNSIAKSGTHLVRPLLEGIPSLKHFAFIYPGKLQQLSEHKLILSKMPSNHFANGHIFYSKEYENMLHTLNLKQIFLYRDPRDIVVSYAYFYMKLKNTPPHRFFIENNMNVKQRLLAFINGFKTDYVYRGDINSWYRNFIEWKYADHVLPITYESLVKSKQSQRKVLAEIIRYLEIENNPERINLLIKNMQENVDPIKSVTFRKGQSGNWKEEFDEKIKKHFKRVAGKLLIELGYEKDYNW